MAKEVRVFEIEQHARPPLAGGLDGELRADAAASAASGPGVEGLVWQPVNMAAAKMRFKHAQLNAMELEDTVLGTPAARAERLAARVQRVQAEMASIAGELEELKAGGGGALPASAASLSDELVQARQQLQAMTPSAAHVELDALRQRLTDLASVGAETAATSAGAGATSEGAAVYEIFYRNVASESAKAVELPLLDRRLSAIESRVGVAGASSSTSTLADRVKRLEDTVASLREVGQMESKLAALSTEIEKVLEAPGAVAVRAAGNVEQMFEMMTRWDSVAQKLPAIVGRLQDLQSVHEDAARYVSSFSQVAEQLSAVEEEHRTNTAVLKELRARLAELTDTCTANFGKLSASIAEASGARS